MSLLPSSYSKVVPIMVAFFKDYDQAKLRNIKEYYSTQSLLFTIYSTETDSISEAVKTNTVNKIVKYIEIACQSLCIAPLFPNTFYTFLCDGIDEYLL